MTVTLALPHLARPLSVIVASRNNVKINAVAAAVQQAFPGVQHTVIGADSQSGVPDQPFGDEETLRGAYNRLASLAALSGVQEGEVGEQDGQQQQQPGSRLLCAIEGGIGWAVPEPKMQTHQHQHPQPPGGLEQQQQQQQQNDMQQQQRKQQRQLECFAWVAVQAPGGRCSHARSASFLLPAAVGELILNEGMELGSADDKVFGRVKSGQGSGTIGKLTGGLLTRQLYYQQAVACALVPLMNPDLYPEYQPRS